MVRSDGRTQFVVQQQTLGPGDFSGTVRVRRDQARGAIAVEVIAGALAGAGAALVRSDDDDHQVAGILLSGVGAAALAASDAARAKHEELWVQRTSTPE